MTSSYYIRSITDEIFLECDRELLDPKNEGRRYAFLKYVISRWTSLCRVAMTPTEDIMGVVLCKMEGSPAHKKTYNGHVLSLAVAPPYRGQNVGRELLSDVESLMQKAGASYVNTYVRLQNPNMKRAFEKFGYSKERIVSGYFVKYPWGEDAVDMRKKL